MYNNMNVCKWCMSGSVTENSVLPRLNNIFNQSINHIAMDMHKDDMGI